MTEQKQDLTPKSPKWPRYLLVVSLGVNLLIVGLVLGAVLRGGPPEHVRGGDRSFGVVGLRSYVRSLDETDRVSLRQSISDNRGKWRAGREVMAQHLSELATILRTEPFDINAVEHQLSKQRDIVVGNIGFGHELLSARIGAMTPEQRVDFAEALEKPREFRKMRQ